MTDAKQVKDDKVDSLNQTLTSVENELMGRALDRRDSELDHALDCINRGAEAGVIDIQCGGEDSSDSDEAEDSDEEEAEDDSGE
jgi:hypothetical protein